MDAPDSPDSRADAKPGNDARPCSSGALIDDMEDGSGRLCGGYGRVGAWYAFNDGLGTQSPAPTTPGTPIPTAEIPGGRGSSQRAMHTFGSGFRDWGAGLGIDLNYDGQSYGSYDASAFNGITFWARSDSPTFVLTVRIATSATTRNTYGGTCLEEPCSPGSITFRPGADWTQYWIPFAVLTQSLTSPFEPDKLTNIQFLVLGGAAFDFWIDDLSFFVGGADCCGSLPRDCAGLVRFSDSALAAAVAAAVAKPADSLTCSDTCALYTLNATSAGISLGSLSDLHCLANLTQLSVLGSEVSDLSPVAALEQLRQLSVRSSRVSELKPLAGLAGLTTLDLASNRIADVTPLLGLTHLASLALADNQIVDASPLAALTNLTTLDLSNNQVSSAKPFAGLTNIVSLHISNNAIGSIDPLLDNAGLDSGDSLWIYGNPVRCNASDLQVIATLKARGVIIDTAQSQGLPQLCP
jgi:Leucine Rich repeats (2 copies)